MAIKHKILVTGSRYWDDYQMVQDLICDVLSDFEWYSKECELIHGGAPGADEMAARFCSGYFDMTVTEFPADWGKHGKSAGPKRNQQMVDYGADICLAFIMPNSKGTMDCLKRAAVAGIQVIAVGKNHDGPCGIGDCKCLSKKTSQKSQ
ncbi:GTP-binding domain [Gordonia phage GordTnk2]|uniref:YspA cpYpsA-related SLOG domain-containing protein n=1 Tax=Gordonia phage GordTnk2 TaxID=1622192 RepID=A0A0E3T5T5_9CAUD|nr:GTP-binding domain [Gordonia phage GordTnk2]AKC02821.1 hypothetical protein GordTnk2_81 [Gordonia phage GordTnk2]